jgi:hypothetical protein
MAYAVVQDIPASWADYEVVAGIGEPLPDGLILHVAGPTDEGFRTIEVWESREACERYYAGEDVDPGDRAQARRTRRDLVTRTTVLGRTHTRPTGDRGKRHALDAGDEEGRTD